jgi:hypothetical protein
VSAQPPPEGRRLKGRKADLGLPTKLPDQLALILLLLPGFVTQRISEYYSTGAKLSDIETLASALAFTLFDALITLAIWRGAEWFFGIGSTPALTRLVYRPPFLALMLLVSTALGFAWAAADARNWLYLVSPTSRSTRQPLWDTRFSENARLTVTSPEGPQIRKGLILVVGTDGAYYLGTPKLSSDAVDKEEALLLEPAAVIRPRPSRRAGEAVDNPGLASCRLSPSVLLQKNAIRVVEFLNEAQFRDGPSYCARLNKIVPDDLTQAPADVAK